MNETAAAFATERKPLAALRWLTGSTLTARERLFVLAGFGLLILLRLPEATLYGRLTSEEGPIFLSYAWHRDSWDALWRSFGGYLNLAANGSTLLAARLVQHGIMPLEHLPRLTMGIAFAFQIVPAALILWGRGDWLTARWVYIASLLMIALAPFSEEVWLNVLHIQFHLTLCCILILVLEPPASKRGWAAQGAILLLAPLCGPGALVLGPLFLARACIERSPARLAQTAVLGLGGLIQLLVFFTPHPFRGHLIDVPSLAGIIFVRMGVIPFGGANTGLVFDQFVVQARHHQALAWWLVVSLSFAYCGLLLMTAWRYRHRAAGWLIVAGLALAAASFGGGALTFGVDYWFNALIAERYNFLPLAAFGIAVVAIAQDRAARWNMAGKILCALFLISGATSFVNPIPIVAEGPKWQPQVSLWREDHSRPLQGWTVLWPIDLSDTDRPCPEAKIETASVNDPIYCESAWLAKLMYGD